MNHGFTDMIGYSKSEALHRTPKFLQGADTSAQTKKRIKDNLAQNKPCKEVLINYRKDQTPYHCEVHIIPLYNQQTTHFIAFEREVG
ncbi:PAS domain S-box-containing protein [Pustulibacterium marinum]|uniref:PAS domain S-box-containing protein n=1 Tax=Pustulibacterium marinum TaxID=1224947 RepID=A0A1I7GB14_9FLAO|nr:PAS domain S-box-containing protein [Pustulibacterium marinum]